MRKGEVIFVFTDDQLEQLWDSAFEGRNITELLLCDISLRLSALEKLYSGKDGGNKQGGADVKTIDILKDALTASPDRSRELIARAVEAEDVTEAECAELVALALKLGAIKARDLL